MLRRALMVLALACGLTASVCAQPAEKGNLDSLVSHALAFSRSQLLRTVAELGENVAYPRSTLPDGTWRATRPEEWTSGFFPGLLWQMEELFPDDSFQNVARRFTRGLERVQFYPKTHDLGFMIFSSFGRGYRLYPSDEYREVVLRTAVTLSKRFNTVVGCIRSWDHGPWVYPVIIDNMMNLELLLWASEHGGLASLREMSLRHAERTMENHVRADGSTYHVVSYDTTRGRVLERVTHQGAADTSCWSRGQAWAIYGFTMVYRYTNDDRFLRTARRVADYFLDHLPEDYIPYWDFQAPGIPLEPRDASAAAIAAAALFELSEYGDRSEHASRYRSAAENILHELCRSPYLAEGTASRGILNHSVGGKPSGNEVDVSLVYADYYFVEAMMKYRKKEGK